MKKILSLFLFLIFLIFPKASYAADNFATSYNVTYQVQENENTKVTFDISLKNLSTNFYASSYRIQLGYKDIENASAKDSGGQILVNKTKNNKGIELSMEFNNKAVGINKVQNFSVSFETKEISKKFGNIWEVNIPGIDKQNAYQSFNTTVNVPPSFGKPTIIKPSTTDAQISTNSIKFSKKDLGNSGVSIAYGENQIYKFDLTYHLRNGNLYPVVTEIAIPSNNNYQEIKITDMNPKPLDVYIDRDGNWLAKYRLLPSEDYNVIVKGEGKINYIPKKEALNENQKNNYLKPQKYWEVNDPEVKKLAKELKTPEAIYKYVVSNLTYDSERVKETQERAGASGVLANKKSAVCLEFTDLFVALSRAAGIPARAVEGYANTSNSAKRPLSLLKDVLHSWPEYYDFKRGAWIMIDPTWENTTEGIDYFNTFDFDHFAFVIKGSDSEYPIPAGGYKIAGQKSTQDVLVETKSNFEKVLPSLSISTNFSEKYLGGLPIKGEIVIANNSGVIAPNQTVNITSNNMSPVPQNLYFDRIPPYGKKVIPVSFNSKPLLTNETDTIKISIGRSSIEKNLEVLPFYRHIFFTFILGGVITVGTFTLIISIFIYKRRRIPIS